MSAIALLALTTLCAAVPPADSTDSLVVLDSMVVTASRSQTAARTTPPRVDVVGARELASTNSRRPSDAIGMLTGVDVQGGTGMGIPEKKTVSLDGLPAYYTLMLVDGARLLSSHFHTGVDMDLVPSANIERIEVLRGPGSAQYGSNAVAGVVNIITKSGTDAPVLDFELRGGTHETFASSLSLRGPIGNRLRYSSFADWEQSNGAGLVQPEERLGQLDYRNLTIEDKVDVALGKTNVDASVHYTSINSTFAHNPATSRLVIPSLTARSQLTPHLSLDLACAYTRWEYQGIEQDIDNSTILFPEFNTVASPHLMLHYTGLRANDISGGVDYDYAVFERMAVPRHDQHREGLFLEDNLHIGSHLFVLGAVRLDMVQNTVDSVKDEGPVVSPSLAVLYRPVDMLGVRLSAGRGFRSPNLQELYQWRFGHEDAIIDGNPKLQPEYSTSLNGSLDLTPGRHLALTVGGAATWIDNMITYYNTGDTTTVFDPIVRDTPTVSIFGRENVSHAFIGEGDISLRLQMKPVNIQVTYTHTYNQNLDSNRILNYYPGSSLTARVSGEWKLGRKLVAAPFVALRCGFGRALWALGMEADEPFGYQALADYQDLSAGLDLTVARRFTAFVKASNLLGQKIETYEDVLMKTNGDRLVEAGIKATVF